MLGLAMTLPMILLGGPLAGYLISLLVVKQMGMPEILTPVLIVTGLVGSLTQAYRLIQKLNQSQKKINSN